MIFILGGSQLLRYHHQFPNPQIKCLAKSGASVSKLPTNPWLLEIILKEIPSCPDQKNDILILMGGTNDFLKRVKLNSIKKAHKKLLRTLRRRFKHIFLCLVPPLPKFGSDVNDDIRVYNRWLNSFDTVTDITIINSFDPYLSSSFPLTIPHLRYFEKTYPSGRMDLIHLNNEGHVILHDLIQRALENYSSINS